MNIHPLIHTIHAYINKHNLITPGTTVILGLSGGPDSVFLLHALVPLHKDGTITLVAAHLDHEWRTDSYQDVNFCTKLCADLGIELRHAKASELGASFKTNGSQEEIGRTMRRHFFTTLKKELPAHATALAHHADDQQETFFIRLLRGASLTGLTAMKPQQDGYIRPLLGVHKQEILAFLDAHGIAYLTDPTNTSDAYLRNRLRNHVLPALAQADSRFNQTFAATLARLQETEDFLDTHARSVWYQIAQQKQNAWWIAIDQLRALHPALQHRILLLWIINTHVPFSPGNRFFDEIMRFLSNSTDGHHQIHHQWGIEKKDGRAAIKPLDR